jgi:hypothetical protein
MFQNGQDPDNHPGWKSWRMPTAANPYIAAEEIEDAKQDLTDLAYAQEYLAHFVTWAGQVFRRIADAIRPVAPTPAVMIGVDWGRTGDRTAFIALSAKREVVAIDHFRGMEYQMQRDRLRAFWERLGKRAWIVAETNAMGGPVVEQLQLDGLPIVGFYTTGPTKAAIIQSLALGFEREQIVIPSDPVLVGELQAFEGKMKAGFMRYGAPEGLHDDTVMALAMAWAGLHAPRDQQWFVDPRTGRPSSTPVEYQISPI